MTFIFSTSKPKAQAGLKINKQSKTLKSEEHLICRAFVLLAVNMCSSNLPSTLGQVFQELLQFTLQGKLLKSHTPGLALLYRGETERDFSFLWGQCLRTYKSLPV